MFDFIKMKLKQGKKNPQDSDIIKPILDYIHEFQVSVEKLINQLEFTKSSGEMLPPWIMRIYPLQVPAIEKLDVHSKIYEDDYWYWRGGSGGKYKTRFLKYWSELGLDEKKKYFEKYDLGIDWGERESWFFELFDQEANVDVTDEEWDSIADDILGNKNNQ